MCLYLGTHVLDGVLASPPPWPSLLRRRTVQKADSQMRMPLGVGCGPSWGPPRRPPALPSVPDKG